MRLSRLSLVLRLPLAALLCSQLVFFSGDVPRGDYYASSAEEVVAFDERDDGKSSNAGLPAATFEQALIQASDLVLSGFGYVPQGIAPDLRATGPPTV
ncbi:MAG: hypothetical protein O2817_12195 [Proteobacteria bacterium]|nr:hypothetical protein [Pseudomonadota bacterium]